MADPEGLVIDPVDAETIEQTADLVFVIIVAATTLSDDLKFSFSPRHKHEDPGAQGYIGLPVIFAMLLPTTDCDPGVGRDVVARCHLHIVWNDRCPTAAEVKHAGNDGVPRFMDGYGLQFSRHC